MRAWQPANFARDWTNLGEASSIGPAAMIQNVVTEDGFLQVIETLFRQRARFGLILRIRFHNFRF